MNAGEYFHEPEEVTQDLYRFLDQQQMPLPSQDIVLGIISARNGSL
jgi:hypothetical protein